MQKGKESKEMFDLEDLRESPGQICSVSSLLLPIFNSLPSRCLVTPSRVKMSQF